MSAIDQNGRPAHVKSLHNFVQVDDGFFHDSYNNWLVCAALWRCQAIKSCLCEDAQCLIVSVSFACHLLQPHHLHHYHHQANPAQGEIAHVPALLPKNSASAAFVVWFQTLHNDPSTATHPIVKFHLCLQLERDLKGTENHAHAAQWVCAVQHWIVHGDLQTASCSDCLGFCISVQPLTQYPEKEMHAQQFVRWFWWSKCCVEGSAGFILAVNCVLQQKGELINFRTRSRIDGLWNETHICSLLIWAAS